MGASDNVRSPAFLFLVLPTTSEAPLFYFWCFRQRQKDHFSIFGAFDNVRSPAFLFLVLSTMSKGPLFYFWCFRQRQKPRFSIFGAFDNVKSSTFLFLVLSTMSEAPLFYFLKVRLYSLMIIIQPISFFQIGLGSGCFS